MRIERCNRRKIILGSVMALSILPGARAYASGGLCAASVRLTISERAAIHLDRNFAVRKVVTDRMLHQTWAIVADCSHPERPLKMIQLGAPISPANGNLVRAAQTIPVAAAQIVPAIATRPPQIAVSETVSSPAPARFRSAAPLPQPLLVRAGDLVHLWSASTNVRLEIEAIALDYGHAGQVIHLRRMGNDPRERVMLAGLVDGTDTAELLP